MKSKILDGLPGMSVCGRNPDVKQVSVVILNMAAVVHMIQPKRANVFGEYTVMHLFPFMEN